MVVGTAIMALIFYLSLRGYRTYQSARDYQSLLQIAHGRGERAMWFLDDEYIDFYFIRRAIEGQDGFAGPDHIGAIDVDGSGEIDPDVDIPHTELFEAFWKPLAGYEGSINFPPAASPNPQGIGLFYLINNEALIRNSFNEEPETENDLVVSKANLNMLFLRIF
jgi:hypothetical protein